MMQLTAEQRDTSTSVDRIRESGSVPAVYYGRKESATPITVPRNEFERVFRDAGESAIITLSLGSEQKQALIREVQRHPLKDTPLHIDFYIVEEGRSLQVSVPLTFDGTAPAVKELGGTLVKVLHELEVEAKPDQLPSEITVDISGMDTLEAQLHVSDLSLPNGVRATHEADEVVAMISQASEEPEEGEETEPDLSSIEVEQRGKEDTEGAESQ